MCPTRCVVHLVHLAVTQHYRCRTCTGANVLLLTGRSVVQHKTTEKIPKQPPSPQNSKPLYSAATQNHSRRSFHKYCNTGIFLVLSQPIELGVLRTDLKAAGVRCSQQKLLDFLDEMCITFTTKNDAPGKSRQGKRGRRGGHASRKVTASQK
ncbi:hypothetical protein BaRGS_00005013 [Batillaria attramentaria]|uniref:Structure-specific endonuclease subunit SLX4 n=1 Tax=Batillaria attramentaria TaxID=370345 RepID=A0ABD0LWK6_9CAEN